MAKKVFLPLLLLMLSACHCKKELDPDGLPPATETGANTLGFLLNGQPWTPKGYVLSGNLSVSYDQTWKGGSFGIAAYQINTSNDKQSFSISMDSLQQEGTYLLNENSNLKIGLSNNTCQIDKFESGVFRFGTFTITKIDKAHGIFAGTFSAILCKQGCSDTLRITNGRFDLKQY